MDVFVEITYLNTETEEFIQETFLKPLHLGDNLVKNGMRKILVDLLVDEPGKLENAMNVSFRLMPENEEE